MRFSSNVGSIASTLCLLAVVTTGCRTTLRPESTESDPVTVDVRMIGMKSADRDRQDVVYTLSGCGAGTANGTSVTDSVVRFQAVRVGKDDQCDVRVVTSQTSDTGANWFGEPGTLYEARKVKVKMTSGQLTATAMLQQLYSNPPQQTPNGGSNIWTLISPLKAPEALTGICTCKISCEPPVDQYVSSVTVEGDKTSGHCRFVNYTKTPPANLTCAKLEVQCGGKFYLGTWSGGAAVDASVAGDQRTPELTLESGNPEQISDTTIEVVVPRQ